MTDPAVSSTLLDSMPVSGVDGAARAVTVADAAQGVQPPMEEITIKVGDLFPNMKQFRAKLGLYGITHRCPYRARRSDNSRFVGICPVVMRELKKEHGHNKGSSSSSRSNGDSIGDGEGDLGDSMMDAPHEDFGLPKVQCPFNIIARRRKEGGVCVTRAILQHAPGCKAPVSFSTSATSAYMSQLMNDSKATIAPREIGKYVHRATGTKLSYSTLWRTSHLLANKERERQDATFGKIVPYLNAFREANPGTLAVVEQRPDARFYRAFLCPGALAEAFGDCPFSLHVEEMPITSFHGGCLMLAYVKDNLGSLLPLALAITPQDDEENWRFFFQQLVAALPILGCPGMGISHSKEPAVTEAQAAILPGSRSLNSTPRVDWTASNTLHEYYSQMSALCTSSYFMIIVGWVTQVAVLVYARFIELEPEHSVFPGNLLGRVGVAPSGWEVAPFGPSDYLVVNAQEKHQTNLAVRTCTCGQWVEHAFPCIHAVRCLPLERLVSLGQFVHPSYLTDSIRRCYSRRMTLINPDTIPSQGESPLAAAAANGHMFVNEQRDDMLMSGEMPLLPPSSGEVVKRGRGRPRVSRPASSGRGAGVGAMYQCGHCHGRGHNSRTCPLNAKSAASMAAAPGGTSAVNMGSGSPEAPAPPPGFGNANVPFTIDTPFSSSASSV